MPWCRWNDPLMRVRLIIRDWGDQTSDHCATLFHQVNYCASVGEYDQVPTYPTTNAAVISFDHPPTKDQLNVNVINDIILRQENMVSF